MSDDIQYLSLPSFDSSRPSKPGGGAAPSPGRYRIDGDLGSGGMGAVFKAYDVDLHREVALKVLHGVDPTPEMLAKFREEAQIGAQLEHPAIVPIYDFGVDRDGRIFLVMKIVRGCALDDCGDLTPLRKIQVVQQIAQALAFAHEKGVIHRDLKPANIMTGAHGEVQIMDWGLAKVLGTPDRPIAVRTARTEGDSTRTMEGAVLGTPHFMAPEQARGEPLDARADLYALGAILYHLLCGEPPVVGASVEAILDKVARGDVRPLPASVPRELRAIVGKAMALRPDDRYQTATAFHDDLQAYLEGRGGRAWRDSAWARARKWMRRHPAVGASAALAVVAVVATFFILERRSGKLVVVTDPKHAEVWVQDDLVDNHPRRLPHEVHGQGASLAPRSYLVTLKMAGYDEATLAVNVPPGRTTELRYRLRPQWDHYFFSSDPQGAEITLTPKGPGESFRVPTPFVVKVPRGEYDVRVALEGYIDVKTSLSVSGIDQNLQEVYTLQKAGVGTVRLKGVPAGTRVNFLQGDKPVKSVTLPHDDPIELVAGRYTLRAEIERHVPDVREFDVAEGKDVSLLLHPRPQELWRVPVEGERLKLLPADADGDGVADVLTASGAEIAARRGFDGFELWRRRTPDGLPVLGMASVGDSFWAWTTQGAAMIKLNDGKPIRNFEWGRETGAFLAGLVAFQSAESPDFFAVFDDEYAAFDADDGHLVWACSISHPIWENRFPRLLCPRPSPDGRVRRALLQTEATTEEGSISKITEIIDMEHGKIVQTFPESMPLALVDTDGDGVEDVAIISQPLRGVQISGGSLLWESQRSWSTSWDDVPDFAAEGLLYHDAGWDTSDTSMKIETIRAVDGEPGSRNIQKLDWRLVAPWPGGAIVQSSRTGLITARTDGRTLWTFAAGNEPKGPSVMADFDADGSPDMAFLTAGGQLIAFAPTGTRAPGGWPTTAIGAKDDKNAPIVIADRWVVETRRDVIVWDSLTGTLAWTLSGADLEAARTRDANGDGADDLLVTGFELPVRIIDTITGRVLATHDGEPLTFHRFIPDADNDGYDDLLLAETDALCVLSSGTLKKLGRWPKYTPYLGYDASLAADFDGDGQLDLSIVNRDYPQKCTFMAVCATRTGAWREFKMPELDMIVDPILRFSGERLYAVFENGIFDIDPSTAETSSRVDFKYKLHATAITGDLDFWELGLMTNRRGNSLTSSGARRKTLRNGTLFERWKTNESCGSEPAFVDIDGDRDFDPVFLDAKRRTVVALAAADGKPLWRVDLGEAIRSAPALLGNRVLVRTNDRWFLIDPRVGKCDFVWIAGEGMHPAGGRCLIER